ncbi:MAG: HEAT repeat domain-containing protein [Kiritimatiellales bacterium]|nr:HEAT repeat domain-containing protein [Kiritimatiellales bacterium]MCF7864524.1 HEAT repeat domain-containing protein [Kiritimatiellales bacterium]
MKKTTILLLLALAGISHAAIHELIDPLGSTNLAVQTEAQVQLLAECSLAGRPGAEAERKAVCAELCAELGKGCSVPVATQLVRQLQRIGGEESVATLVPMLGNSDEHLREDVRQALEVNPSPAAGQALQAALKNAKELRWTAGLIDTLGARGDAGSTELIIPFLGSTDPMIFSAAAKALSRLDQSDGIRALAQQRGKEQGERKAVLTAALFETDRTKVFQQLYAAGESNEVRAVAVLGLVMNGGGKVADAAMASGHPGFQSAVIEAASQRKDAALYSLLAKNLGNLPPYLQVQALGVLEFSGNTGHSALVATYLSSSDLNVQIAAAQALSKVGTADAIPALLSCGSDDAKRAMGLINAAGVDEILMQTAAASGDAARRAVAIESLALRGRTQLMDRFFAYASDPDPTVAKAGVEAIGELGRDEDLEKAVELLLSQEVPPLSRDVLKAIVTILRRSVQPDAAEAVLVGGMSGATPAGQALILRALAQVGSPSALVSVAQAVHSDDAALRKEAIKLLGNWSNTNALPVLIEVAGDPAVPLADYVVSMRGVTRLLAGQKKLDRATANRALEVCRRPEERQLILDLLEPPPDAAKK